MEIKDTHNRKTSWLSLALSNTWYLLYYSILGNKVVKAVFYGSYLSCKIEASRVSI